MNMPYLSPVRTVANLLHELGDVPAERVRMTPFPGTATVGDLEKPGGDLCELVDGTLVEKTVGEAESLLGGWMFILISQYARRHNLGYSTPADGFYSLRAGPVRGPDVSFISWDQLPGRRRTGEAFPKLAPDLVVEVLSVDNTKAEMARKRDEYFRSGVRLVWEVDPRARTVCAYTSIDQVRELTAADTLSGEPVLPGFTLLLADLFAELDRHG